MNAETFIKLLKENAPTIASLRAQGLSEKEAADFILNYEAREKSKSANSNLDELLRLQILYYLDTIEVGMISFAETFYEDENYIYVGNFEADHLVINKSTKMIQVLEYGTDRHLLWDCAINSANFLSAISKGVLFNVEWLSNKDDLSDQEAFYKKALICSNLAGGNQFLDFYLVFLGYSG